MVAARLGTALLLPRPRRAVVWISNRRWQRYRQKHLVDPEETDGNTNTGLITTWGVATGRAIDREELPSKERFIPHLCSAPALLWQARTDLLSAFHGRSEVEDENCQRGKHAEQHTHEAHQPTL